jgi:uncharacterized membrane protein
LLLPLLLAVRSISCLSNESLRPLWRWGVSKWGLSKENRETSRCDLVLNVYSMKRVLMVVGVVLILLGIAAVLHPTYTYHHQQQVAQIGSFQATVDEEKTAQIPIPATAALLVAGLALVLIGAKSKS